MADVLSVLPTEGGLKVGWIPSVGTAPFQVRHSPTGAGTWTTVTDIETQYTVLTGLDYTVVYDVQVSDDGVTWSASVTGQPWIDPEAEFGTLFRDTDVTAATDHGDLGASYENDTWDIFVAFDRARLGAFQSFAGINANFGTAHGLCGLLIGATDGDLARVIAVTGTSSSTTVTSGATTFGRGRGVIAAGKSGTDLTLYDEDGGTLGSGTTTSATMDWSTTTTQRTTVNGHWATTVSPNLGSRLVGTTLDVIYVPGGVTSDERTALLRLFREKYIEAHPTQRVELFLDEENVESNTVGAATVLVPTRQGEVLQSVPSSHYSGISFAVVKLFADGRWRMWITAVEYTASVLTDLKVVRFDSADGLTWVEPNLGHVGSTGTIIDGTATSNMYLGAQIVSSGGDYQYFTSFDEVGNTRSARYYGASDEDSVPSVLANIDPGFAAEGKTAAVRSDNRYLTFLNDGHSLSDRSIFTMITEDGSEAVGGTHVLLGDIPEFQAADPAEQFYDIKVHQAGEDLWLGFVTMYDEPDEYTHLHLYISRDEGLTWTEVPGHWLEHADPSEWDGAQVYAGSLVRVGDTWRFYYTGHDQPHADVEGSSIGYVTLTYGRLAEIAA